MGYVLGGVLYWWGLWIGGHVLVLVLSDAVDAAEAVPALSMLAHTVRVLPAAAQVAEVAGAAADVVVVDARVDLVAARNGARLLRAGGCTVPVLAVLAEGGLAALGEQWQVDDFVVVSAGLAEVDARLRMLVVRAAVEQVVEAAPIRVGGLTVDETSYSARLQGAPLNLTYKEFELLKFLVQHPGQVFTRAQLLAEVWGYDYYGGTRTVDVHVRRLRSKLGGEHEHLITTVRNVGYSFDSAR